MAENRSNSIQLHYLTPLGYPSGYANRLQVAKMSEAFSKKVDFTLYIKSAVQGERQIFDDYRLSKFNIVEVGTSKLWPRSFWYALKLRKLIKKTDKETVFYSRDFLLTIWLIFLSPRFRNNFFFEIHSLGRFPEFIYKNIFKYAKGIISTNQKKADDIIKKYRVSEDKIMVFGNGIDLKDFDSLPNKEDLRNELKLSSDKPTILYAGTYSDEYGKKIIESLKEELAGKAEVIVCTNKPRLEALKYMKASDILLAPYSGNTDRNQLYRSPIKIKEYMASGNPVVVSDLPAIREIASEKAVYFAEPDNTKNFLAKIEEILDNPEEVKLKTTEAKEKVKEYSWQNRAQKILEFILKKI